MDLGKSARQDIVNNCSQQKLAQIVLEKIENIVASKQEILEKKKKEKQNGSKKKGKEKDNKLSKVTIKIIDDS